MIKKIGVLFFISFICHSFADDVMTFNGHHFIINPDSNKQCYIQYNSSEFQVGAKLPVFNDEENNTQIGQVVVGEKAVMVFYNSNDIGFMPFPIKNLMGDEGEEKKGGQEGECTTGGIRGAASLSDFKRDLAENDSLPMIHFKIDGYKDIFPPTQFDEDGASLFSGCYLSPDLMAQKLVREFEQVNGRRVVKSDEPVEPCRVVKCDAYFLNSRKASDTAFLVTMADGQKFLHCSVQVDEGEGPKKSEYWITLAKDAFAVAGDKPKNVPEIAPETVASTVYEEMPEIPPETDTLDMYEEMPEVVLETAANGMYQKVPEILPETEALKSGEAPEITSETNESKSDKLAQTTPNKGQLLFTYFHKVGNLRINPLGTFSLEMLAEAKPDKDDNHY